MRKLIDMWDFVLILVFSSHLQWKYISMIFSTIISCDTGKNLNLYSDKSVSTLNEELFWWLGLQGTSRADLQ